MKEIMNSYINPSRRGLQHFGGYDIHIRLNVEMFQSHYFELRNLGTTWNELQFRRYRI